ncbi:MAG: L,D-transpeptidase family protein [Caulobacteraceae bacterium]
MPYSRFTRRRCFGAGASLLVAACSSAPPPDRVGQSLADPAARGLYASRGWKAAWNRQSAHSLYQAVAGAHAHGLDPKTFLPRRTPGDAARDDEALTLAALAYARALSGGLVDPRRIETIYTLARNWPDLGAGLAKALASRNVGGWLNSLAPADREYAALSAAYLAAVGQTQQQGLPEQGPPPADQARQLAVNMERRRWLSRVPPAHRIDVNTAAAFMTYLKPGAPPWSALTVDGRDDHPTPCIEADFRKIIANPPWIVPKDIAAREVLPKGPGYLAREDMHWVDGHLEQRAGPKSALGRVKFDLEDPYDIYLHDTPSKSLFAALDRHASHGCVRVQNAVDLARAIAAETGVADKLDEALATTHTREIDLGQSIPVRMLYHTAYLDASGPVQLAADAYGADERLAEALGLGPGRVAAHKEPEVLFGP